MAPGNNQQRRPHRHRFMFCLQTNQQLEMNRTMRGNQATNSSNINPICERGNEIFPFAFNWRLGLFFSPGKVEFLLFLCVSINITLRWITLPAVHLLCPWAFLSRFKKCWLHLLAQWEEEKAAWSLLYNFIHSSTKKYLSHILRRLQMHCICFMVQAQGSAMM